MKQHKSVKAQIKEWWAANPMTYAKDHGETSYQVESEREEHELGSREFFKLADATFLEWNKPLHKQGIAFAKLFNYEKYKGANVLEIGCGMGFMAMNWGQQGAKIVAADLNPIAVKQTRRRFDLFGVSGSVVQMDAERLPYGNESFAYCYSWGVLHHTPGIQSAIDTIYRLLEPGGEIGLMLYNRNSFREKYFVDYVEGYMHMESKFLNPLQLNSRYGDGHLKEGNPHTWPVTQDEVRHQLLRKFENVRIEVFGTETANLFDFLIPGLGSYFLPSALKNSIARRWGWSLWITGKKPS